MKKNNLYSLLTLAVVFVFIFSLFSTVNVLADDSTPPAPTDAPIVDMPPTEVPVPTEVPTQEPAVQEVANVEEILAQVPEGTDVVVLDENGNPLPMASQAAADAILSDTDPMWCPDGQTPGTDMNDFVQDCTNPFNRFTTASGLINTLQGGSYSGPGTIYISSGNIAGADQGKNIVLNGNSMLTLSSDNLTIQGGWDFGSNSVNNRSVFVNSTFEIKNWTGNITVNDLKFELASGISGDGLTLKNIDGNVTLNNVVITDSQNNNGLFINNVDNIEINDSKFNDNNKNGADLSTDGTIDLNNVIAKGNDDHGVDAYADGDLTIVDGTYQNNGKRGVRAQSDNGDINITGSEFINNDMSGIRAEAYNGNVTLTDVLSRNNDIHGANLFASETISINGGQFYNNDASGVHTLSGAGDLLVTSGVFTFNGDSGLYAEALSGDATISGDFSANWGDGLVVENMGDITITNVTATGNYDNGAILDNSCGCLMGNIFISSSNFDSNGTTGGNGRGLIAHSYGDITLTNVSASENAGGGAELDNTSGSGSITLTGLNKFNDNGYGTLDIGSVGLWAVSSGDITLNGVEAMRNGLAAGTSFPIGGGGAFAGTSFGNIFISNSIFNDNCNSVYCGFLGFGFAGFGSNVTLENVTANGNGFWSDEAFGILILSSGNVLIKNSAFNGNGQLGEDSAGAFIQSSSGNIDIYCSTFNDNTGTITGYGLSIGAFGTTTLNGVTVSGNSVGDIDLTGGLLVVNPFDCNPEGSKKVLPPNLPLKVANVTSGQVVGLDCEHFGGTKLILENGNSATLPCPIDDSASIIDNNKIEDLPKPLPEGVTFKSAFTTSVTQNGEKLGKLINSAVISFVIPEGADVSKLAILFWDGSEWTEVKNTYVRNDPVTGESYFEAFVNETGTFVLVQK